MTSEMSIINTCTTWNWPIQKKCSVYVFAADYVL